MATLTLAENASFPFTYIGFDIEVEKLILSARGVRYRDARWDYRAGAYLNHWGVDRTVFRIKLTRPLSLEARFLLPPTAVYDHAERLLEFDAAVAYEHELRWVPEPVLDLHDHEDVLIETLTPLTGGTYGQVKWKGYPVLVEMGERVRPHTDMVLSEWVKSWPLTPVYTTYSKLIGQDGTRLKRNTPKTTANTMLPARFLPAPTPIVPKKSGRFLDLGDDSGEKPVIRISPDLMKGSAPGRSKHEPAMITLGVRDDGTSYRQFASPAFMADFDYNSSSAPSALPVSRAMILGSDNAFHILYAMLAFAKREGHATPVPMLYCIPVLIENPSPVPSLLRGLPLSTTMELQKVEGLTNALARGLNALQGELLKLKRAGFNREELTAWDLDDHKPTGHMLVRLGGHGRSAWEFGSVTMPVLGTILETLKQTAGKLKPRFLPDMPDIAPITAVTSDELQPVATSVGRALDL